MMTLTAQEWDTRRLKATGQMPLSPMPAELITAQEMQQAELEAQGDWAAAARLNAWISGAFMSEQDFIAGRAPLMRIEFIERMGQALQHQSPKAS